MDRAGMRPEDIAREAAEDAAALAAAAQRNAMTPEQYAAHQAAFWAAELERMNARLAAGK